MEKDFDQFEKRLGVMFENKDLLKQAVVHRSYLNEHEEFKLSHNERLEFLGDAVLELVTTEYLFKTYPKSPEGTMTNWRAAVVNTNMLAQVSESLGVNDYLYLSKGEAKGSQKARELILANALEAIIGACYLDQGYDVTKKFIVTEILIKLKDIIKENTYIDPKSKLQEKTQEVLNVTPSYKVLKETGPDHKKHFIIGAYVDDEKVGEGEGYSKQQAQVAAAKDAIKKKKFLEVKGKE
ncbi:ribonuclease III [Patescibacteria group bacterium]|nr:ribonuclease III [Patescibacteria group bacterium]